MTDASIANSLPLPSEKEGYVIVSVNEDGDMSVYGSYTNVTVSQVEEIAALIQLEDTSGNTIIEVHKLGETYIPTCEDEK